MPIKLSRNIRQYLKERRTGGRDVFIRSRGIKGLFDSRALSAGCIEEITKNVDDLIEDGVVLKDGGATKVSRVGIAGRSYVIKRYNWRGCITALRYMIKGSRARRVWLCGHMLESVGVHTPRPVCWLEKSRCGVVVNSYIINEYVEGVRLFHYLRDEKTRDSERFAILKKMLDVLLMMHSNRVTHGDLKLSNVLVSGGEIYLVDLDATARNRFWFVHRAMMRKEIQRFWDRLDTGKAPEEIKRKIRGFRQSLMSGNEEPPDNINEK